MRLLFASVLTVYSVSFSLPAFGAEDVQQTAGVLFPDAKSWATFDSLPKADTGVKFNSAQLLSELKKADPNGFYAKCETAKEIFASNAASLRLLDVNGDGDADLVYSGQNPCGEQDVTLAWIKQKGVYTFATPQPFPRTAKILKLNGSSKLETIAISAGCCDMQEDTFYRIRDREFLDERVVDKGTFFPATGLAVASKGTSRSEIILRSQPKVNDVYDYDQSQHLMTAVIGNILGKYLAGGAYIKLAEQNANGKKWSLVTMESSDHLRYYSSSPAKTGWILNSKLK